MKTRARDNLLLLQSSLKIQARDSLAMRGMHPAEDMERENATAMCQQMNTMNCSMYVSKLP